MEFDGRFERRNFGPWKRGRPESRPGLYRITINGSEQFDDYIYANMDINIDAKRAALKVSASVVSVISLTEKEGKKEMMNIEDTGKRGNERSKSRRKEEKEEEGGDACLWGSGTIIDCEDVNGTYVSTILTSASLLRSSTELDVVPDDIKIDVYLSDGKLFKGQIYTFDFHYNIAAIKIKSGVPLPVATLRFLDDSISIDPNENCCSRVEGVGLKSFQLRPDSDSFNLCPGEMVVAIGRYFKEPYDLMAAPGKFSLDVCSLDCDEVFRADCIITKCGIGGPLVNRYGEVIGVNFYDTEYTPFLPINIASKCLEHFKKYGRFSRPWLGMVMTNLYATGVANLEKIIQKSPNICKGVIVEEVILGSPADRAGILCDDVIIKCNGNSVQSFLEFLGIVWDKTGESVELVVIRTSNGGASNRKIVVDITSSNKINRWPVPKSSKLSIERYRV